MDKLRNIIKYDKKTMLFITVIVILGVISGSFFTVILNGSDKKQVIESLQSFTTNITNGTYNYLDSLKNVLTSNLIILLLIWILGISIIGIIIVIGLLFWKSFTLGFTIGSFILTFNFKGLIIGLFYIFPSLIINILIFMYLSSYSAQLSIVLIKSIMKKKTLNFKSFINNYAKVLGISFLILTLSGLYEVFINPYILKIIINLLF